MKQKNYDVQQMYKEYMQGVGSDPTAIEDILSGERQPANTGARIKHSRGRMIGVTAAAAAVAICAGIGFSNMNANDDSSIKPAAATTTTAVTPAKQAAQSFKLEATSMTAAPLGARTVLTLTATDEKGREIIQKYGSKDVAKNSIWLGGNESTQRPEIIDSTGFHHEWHDDCRVAKVRDDQMTFIYDTYLLFEAANEAMPFTVNVFCPDENKQPTADQIANGEQGNLSIIASAKLSYKVNAAEQVFTSANGEVFRVSDFYFYTNHEDKNNLSNLLFDMKFNFANSTQRSFVEQELSHLDKFGTDTLCIGGGYINGEYKLLHFFNDSINSDEVTSIIYDGVEFTPQGDAKISIEKTIVDSSERAFSIEMLIKADNDAGRELLRKNASTIKFTINESVGGMTVCSSQSSAKFEKDRLSLYITGSIYGKHVEKVAVEMKPDPSVPSEILQALGTSGNVPTIKTELPKTLTDKVFVSTTGEHFWLSELFATTDHNRSSKKASHAVFKLKDGDEVSESDYNTSRAGNTDQKQETIFFNEQFPYDPSDVASIIYDGVEFKAK